MRAACAVVEKDQVCGKPVVGFGYCSTHYARFKRNGSPLLPKLTANPGVEQSVFFAPKGGH